MRRVSYSTWHYCVSLQQETVRERFPIRLDAIVFLTGRKLFAKGFLLDMALLCFLPAGNCLRIVSYSTWHHCVSCRQETICEGFPIRHGITVFLADRKLFAKGFLFDLTPLCFNATGNYLRRVSYSTWHHCVSYRQETVSPGDFSTPLEMTWEAWQHCVSCRQETFSPGDFSTPLEMTGGMAAMGFSTTVNGQRTADSG